MSSKKSNKKKAPAIDLSAALAAVVAAGPNGTFAPEDVCKALEAEGLAEYQAEVKDENGFMAVRATAAGVAKATGEVATFTPSAPKVETSFAIESGVSIPAPIGRGRSGSKYPFDLLEVGQSFFVPDSTEQPDAAASLASTVSGATQRFATDHATETKTVKGKTVPKKVYSRKFALRKVEAAKDPSGMNGARVWRVDVSGLPE